MEELVGTKLSSTVGNRLTHSLGVVLPPLTDRAHKALLYGDLTAINEEVSSHSLVVSIKLRVLLRGISQAPELMHQNGQMAL